MSAARTFTLLEKRIEELCEQTGISDVAVAMIESQQVVFARGFGAWSVDTIVPVASLSKPVFAYVVLRLCDQGVLDLDAPLDSYLPETYTSEEPLLARATVRHALSHTTGLPNWRDPAGLQAAFPPGSAFHYSTEGMIYLQTVVEAVVGQPIHEYMQRQFFEPLGMKSSRLVPEDLSQFLPHLPAGLRAYGPLSLHTTVLDYASFMIQMMQIPVGGPSSLSTSLRHEILSPQALVGRQENLAWGLGWGLQLICEEAQYFWHWGARRKPTRCFAMGCHFNGVVILTGHADGLNLCDEIARLCLELPGPFPAFRWLLPPESWRADGN